MSSAVRWDDSLTPLMARPASRASVFGLSRTSIVPDNVRHRVFRRDLETHVNMVGHRMRARGG